MLDAIFNIGLVKVDEKARTKTIFVSIYDQQRSIHTLSEVLYEVGSSSAHFIAKFISLTLQ